MASTETLTESGVRGEGSTRALFGDRRLRCTAQRLAVFEALRACTRHPTAEELFRIVKPTMQHLSLATVYNTLEVLCSARLARKLPTVSGTCRYDADTTEHVHLRICEPDRTEEIADVPDDLGRLLLASLPEPVLQRIERRFGVRVDGVSIQVHATRNGVAR